MSSPRLRRALAGPGVISIGHLRDYCRKPETIIFFVAFVPQFISAHYGYWMQAAILFVTFVTVVTLSDGFYAVAANWVAGFLKGPKVHHWAGRIGGAILLAAGIATATLNA